MSSASELTQGPTQFGLYIHVPFCQSRCGYCDFNTYVPAEVGGKETRQEYVRAALRELEIAAQELARTQGEVPEVNTVFVGGGTPTMLPATDLTAILARAQQLFPFHPAAEITTEANPDTVDRPYLEQLRAGGFNRLSLGMQSTSSRVLQILERTHTPGRALLAIEQGQQAGFEHLNLDLIYGTPGEREEELRDSLAAVVASGVDHVSAYALIVEDGTSFARRMRSGELPMPDDDVLADRYELVAHTLETHGYQWYEISNWAKPGGQCQHNLGYWRRGQWWGIGPGAHSFVGDRRWWNKKRPATYAQDLLQYNQLPVADAEQLSFADRYVERVMLELRLREGLAREAIDDSGADAVQRAFAQGYFAEDAFEQGRLVLTQAGRLLADAIVRDIVQDWEPVGVVDSTNTERQT